MSETKATPGPWIFDNFCYVWRGDDLSNLRGGMISDADEEETWIQRMRGVGRNIGYQELQANGRLIAACPTMYEFISRKATEGDNDAKQIIESIYGIN